MERDVLVLNFTNDTCFNNSPVNLSDWHFIHASSVCCAYKILKKHNCLVAVALVGQSEQQSVLKAVKQLSASQGSLLWLALFRDGDSLLDDISYCFNDYFLDYHHLPVDWARLDHTLGHIYGMAQLKRRTMHESSSAKANGFCFGESEQMQRLKEDLDKVACTDETLLIGGETGTGKGLCAQYIHSLSPRKDGPFITVNCGALPPTLIHAELFGHEKGAFTGASKQYIGRIERAHKGTLFLDEIGDLSLELQINLLHFLEESYIDRLGGNQPTEVDCRIIFATHVNLENAVDEGLFREDLYYRINIIQLELPSLRNHISDIPILANDCLQKLTPAGHLYRFSKSALLAMEQYSWPGNVRELKNRIQRAIIMSDSDVITETDLAITPPKSSLPDSDVIDLVKHRAEVDTEVILAAIKKNNYNISAAARELSVSRTTFYRLIKKCKIKL
ncbi:sigma-54-dependent Fis family transcriptional regulator [Salinimonas sp. HHU 13199]|uniref:Sigma-54-dependent Fis family transcriptional regulator n=1 Tax=Salinimonas profundi TaxID=2729140 RepID=A0ABR8LG78_9ALTE|nr:sigma-54 dependent transcriptional regulator [Salinimonas profundi]MBD3584310.1 sigma-54-dependent Fis family transcriptional regulator [Salinimonas profundi]